MYSGSNGGGSVANKLDELNFDDVELEEPGFDGGGTVDGDVEEVNDVMRLFYRFLRLLFDLFLIISSKNILNDF